LPLLPVSARFDIATSRPDVFDDSVVGLLTEMSMGVGHQRCTCQYGAWRLKRDDAITVQRHLGKNIRRMLLGNEEDAMPVFMKGARLLVHPMSRHYRFGMCIPKRELPDFASQ
jgi:hypothetical protein